LALLFGVATVSAQAQEDGVKCIEKDKSFREFLPRFTDNRQFQLQRITFPLVVRFGEPFLAPPTIELWGIAAIRDFKTPIILSMAERKKRGLEQKVLSATEQLVEVYHFRDEADSYRIRYLFRNYAGCWYLEQFHDTGL
jgi:hypothetical protein